MVHSFAAVNAHPQEPHNLPAEHAVGQQECQNLGHVRALLLTQAVNGGQVLPEDLLKELLLPALPLAQHLRQLAVVPANKNKKEDLSLDGTDGGL